jgi:DNA polymerase-4
MVWLCRDCFETGTANEDTPCAACGSARTVNHAELDALAIAHIDCDAFYATVEKRDNPELKNKPVLVGGSSGRGVIMAACYVARRYGCRSAMPMFQARKLCPDAVVIRPDMAKYQREGRRVRELMLETTPLVEPLSVDEAFLDLSGTEKLHRGSPAQTLARLSRRIESEIGITVTVGLSHNKFLAKIASDLDKPRGFAVIGRDETLDFLDGQPVSALWGVGRALQRRLEKDGFDRIGSLRSASEKFLTQRYGSIGSRLYRFSRGEDNRRVDPAGNRKSISAETTFSDDLRDAAALEERLWPLCEKVSARTKAAGLGGRVVTLKLKTAGFSIRTRRQTLQDPTQLAETLWTTGRTLLAREANGAAYRLIGIGLSDFIDGKLADPPTLADPDAQRTRIVERTIDDLRTRFGQDSIGKGRRLPGGKFGGTSRPPSR